MRPPTQGIEGLQLLLWVVPLVAQTATRRCRATVLRFSGVALSALCFQSVAALSRYTPEMG